MKIMMIGYGKMGKTIERIALEKGYEVPVIVDVNQEDKLKATTYDDVDVAIEFTQPQSAFNNIKQCLENGIPVVSGTTGWLDRKDEIDKLCQEKKGAFLYASNFSVGVNIFFHLNKVLADVMDNVPEYDVDMTEIHHIHKLDEPSGTAITLAQGIMSKVARKSAWKLNTAESSEDIAIEALREGEVPGTHIVRYKSDIDTLEIKHEAHSREGFASGAVVAAKWLRDKQGVFDMKDVLQFA